MSYLNYLLTGLTGCAGLQSGVNEEGANGSNWYVIVIYIVIFIVFIYFIMVRPQRKQRQKQQDTMNQMEPGDSVLTTSGFYGTIVSVTADTVIVEFGNNKNCRIPMSKQAISQVEKANAATQAQEDTQASNRKKFFDKVEKEGADAAGSVNDLEDAAEGVASDVADAADDSASEAADAAQDAVEDAGSNQ